MPERLDGVFHVQEMPANQRLPVSRRDGNRRRHVKVGLERDTGQLETTNMDEALVIRLID